MPVPVFGLAFLGLCLVNSLFSRTWSSSALRAVQGHDDPGVHRGLLVAIAALDVFDKEPMNADRSAIFAGCRNLVPTPHIAGVTIESNVRVSWVTVENARKHPAGA